MVGQFLDQPSSIRDIRARTGPATTMQRDRAMHMTGTFRRRSSGEAIDLSLLSELKVLITFRSLELNLVALDNLRPGDDTLGVIAAIGDQVQPARELSVLPPEVGIDPALGQFRVALPPFLYDTIIPFRQAVLYTCFVRPATAIGQISQKFSFIVFEGSPNVN